MSITLFSFYGKILIFIYVPQIGSGSANRMLPEGFFYYDLSDKCLLLVYGFRLKAQYMDCSWRHNEPETYWIPPKGGAWMFKAFNFNMRLCGTVFSFRKNHKKKIHGIRVLDRAIDTVFLFPKIVYLSFE